MTDQLADLSPDTLFRSRSVAAVRRRLPGRVCVATPPSTRWTLGVGCLSLALLGMAAYGIEVPERAHAVGVLMPADGLLRVIATDTGVIADLAVDEGTPVEQGQVLVRIRSDRNAPDRSPLSESQIRSMQRELDFMERARAAELDVDARRASALERQVALAHRRLAKARLESELQSDHVRIIEQRVERMQKLAAQGALAPEQLAGERSAMLHAKATAAGFERGVLEIRTELTELERARDELPSASGIAALRFRIERERLLRQIGRAEIDGGTEVRAPASGTVARLAVRPGFICRPGDTLMTLIKVQGPLEAWLYLPSDQVGQLESGQSVQLRLDAYPHEKFGTLEAVVSTVSTIALLGSDLAVPLPIAGPVFEVRASISADGLHGFGSVWPLAPGTSFRADVVRNRYRLYQWLLRSMREYAGASAHAGA